MYKRQIFTERNGIYIIDLQKTVKKVEEAYNFIRETVAAGKSVLFVGTKKPVSYTHLDVYKRQKIMSSKDEEKDEKETIKDNKKLNLYLSGLALQLINPKVILYSITVISNFIIPYYKSNTALILFSLLLSIIGFASITSWALFGSIFNKFLSKYKKQFNIVMGIL